MNTLRTRHLRNRIRAQVLPAAVIVLSVLLVVGFVFLGLLNRNIVGAGNSRKRSTAQDLAEAGIRYAHAMLVNSASRADFTPEPVQIPAVGDFTRDPDILYVRPGTGYPLRNPADTVVDKGGPDGLGPYSRIEYPGGRDLLRIRWALADDNVLAAVPTGAFRQPAKLRSYIIIESVGRNGTVNLNDPTTLPSTSGIQFRNYASDVAFRATLAQMHERDGQFPSSRKLVALASTGIANYAMFITDKDQSSRPAEIGSDNANGMFMDTTPVTMTMQFGGPVDAPTGSISGGGSIMSNAPLRFFGTVRTILNQGLGDAIRVAGATVGASDTDVLNMIRTKGDDTVTADNDDIVVTNTGATLNAAVVPGSLDSSNPNSNTFDGLIRDGNRSADRTGQPRSMGRLEPPSFLFADANLGINTYLSLCRNSGRLGARGNTGRFGHGGYPYINNTTDLQIRSDETGREDMGGQESLIYDWLNPNNGDPTSGWNGPYYAPVGAYLRLTWDGFSITRDGRAPANLRTWRRPDGTDSGLTTIRYRIGGDPDGAGPQPPYVINSLTNPADIDAVNPVWTNGFPFGGVLYFEGNVRVRGVIPTDQQLTVVSMGTIYIEGSITKGIVSDAAGTRINRPSRSMAMLMAKDYVTVNTTQFFGIDNGQGLNEVDESSDPRSGNALRMSASTGGMGLTNEYLFNSLTVAGRPAINKNDPTSWRPFFVDYRDPLGGGPIIPTLLMSHAMDAGPGSVSFTAMEINRGLGTSTYNWFMDASNSASPPYAPGTWGPVKGLGGAAYQRYPQFESKGFPLLDPATADPATLWAGTTLTAAGNTGTYSLVMGGAANTYGISPTNLGMATTNDYVMRRAAVVPHDIRIEASVYAEEGSFFIIPGRWFNQNSSDRRDTWIALGATNAARNAARLANFGASPETPFFQEPLDVKLTIVGSVSQNMPAPISAQTEYMKKWGWIPREHGSSGQLIPTLHVPAGFNVAGADTYVPNLTIVYDPALATGQTYGFNGVPNSMIRFRRIVPDPVNNPAFTIDYPLPPMPRLPVSPSLAYFGEINP